MARPIKPLDEMTIRELLDFYTECEIWIQSDSNDGRLSSGSSAELDFHGDMKEDVEKELVRRTS